MSAVTPGRRLPDGHDVFAPGDYGKLRDGWYGRPPRGGLGNLENHDVTEHEDGTITVSPSILIDDGRPERRWHGYLEHGVWREC